MRVRCQVDGAAIDVQEPIAFLGGIFAGFLGLSLDQDPLKDWIQQTAADSQARFIISLLVDQEVFMTLFGSCRE